MAYTVKLFITSGTTWQVPNDWSSVNTVECIGAGGAGSFNGSSYGNGGGGGAYAKITNLSLVPGSTINVNIGIGGPGTAPTGGYGVQVVNQNGGDTWFYDTSTVLAKGGSGGSASGGGQGGLASQSVGSVKYSGGSGAGNSSPSQGFGGGGAAGLNGAGNSSFSATGGSGDAGFGGAAGQPGREFVISNGTIGSGSGGGGSAGGNGGLYGGGGGSSILVFSQSPYITAGSQLAGAGANGLIFITYLSPSAQPPVGNYTFLTGSGSFFVTKDNWNSDNYNFIAAIGGGGSQYGGGGGFSLTSNIKLTIGQPVYYSAGTGGVRNTGQGNGGNSWVNIAGVNTPPTNSTQGILARGGTLSTSPSVGGNGIGGQASAGIGTIKYSGGNAIFQTSTADSSGGAAGPNGNGVNANNGQGGAGDAGYGGSGGGIYVNSVYYGNGGDGRAYIKSDGTIVGSGGGGGRSILSSPSNGGSYGGGGYDRGGNGVIILFWITPAVVKLSVSNWLTQKFLPFDSTRGSLNWISQNYFNNPTKTTFAISQMFKKITFIQVFTSSSGVSTWTIPATWNNSSNSIEAIGAGGSTRVDGNTYISGGGGGYFKKYNIDLTGYTSITYQIGGTVSVTVGSTTYSATAGAAPTGGTGVNGDVNYSGGNGAYSFFFGFGASPVAGGGGAAGPLSAGTNGSNSAAGKAGSGGILASTSGSYIYPGDGRGGSGTGTYGGGGSINLGSSTPQPGVLVITWTKAIALPDSFILTISTNTANYNLYTAAIAAGWNQISPITLIINQFVFVYSTSTTNPALIVSSSFPAGTSITIINSGNIIGAGGNGGIGAAWNAGTSGTSGGNALLLQFPTIIINYGVIGGGGGGGGGSSTIVNLETYDDPGGSGGGGAGMNPGQPGGSPSLAFNGYPSYFGIAGGTYNGGAGGTPSPHGSSAEWMYGYTGGNGGNLGQFGANGSGGYGYGLGGANGIGISGNQYVATGSSLGDVRGTTGFSSPFASGSADGSTDLAGATSGSISTSTSFSCAATSDILGPYTWSVNSSVINGIAISIFPVSTSNLKYTVYFNSTASVDVGMTGNLTATFVITVTASTGQSTSMSFTVTHTYSNSGSGGGGGGGGSCFLAGSPVVMADRTFKPIEQVKPGDLVIGAFGETNEVLALDWVVLGNRWMYKINNEHSTSDDHPHVSADKKFYSAEPEAIYAEWGKEYPVILKDGSIEKRTNIGLTKTPVEQLVEGIHLQTLSGARCVEEIAQYRLPPETPLYNLVVGGSHTYFVEGYAVTGWPREDDFDYESWKII